MAKLFGLLVGAALANAAATPKTVDHFYERSTDHVLRRDRIELNAAAVNDQISLGIFGSGALLDPHACVIHFDDLGATTTLNIGIATDDDALVAGQDVSTAAGSFSLFKGVDIANYYKPLWQLVGLASDPGGKIELLATIKTAAATGTVVWSIKGQDR